MTSPDTQTDAVSEACNQEHQDIRAIISFILNPNIWTKERVIRLKGRDWVRTGNIVSSYIVLLGFGVFWLISLPFFLQIMFRKEVSSILDSYVPNGAPNVPMRPKIYRILMMKVACFSKCIVSRWIFLSTI